MDKLFMRYYLNLDLKDQTYLNLIIKQNLYLIEDYKNQTQRKAEYWIYKDKHIEDCLKIFIKVSLKR